MRRIAALAALGLALAGCRLMPEKAADEPAPSGTADADAPREPAAPAKTVGGFSRTGDWAANPALCAGGAWHFRQGRVATDGETSCDIRASTIVSPERTELQMACVAEGTATSERWTLTREDDGRMRVQRVRSDGGGVSDIILQRCG